jgi:hypothetical protein
LDLGIGCIGCIGCGHISVAREQHLVSCNAALSGLKGLKGLDATAATAATWHKAIALLHKMHRGALFCGACRREFKKGVGGWCSFDAKTWNNMEQPLETLLKHLLTHTVG